ncbi:ABC transporter ATP-binding protein [Neomoorella thermoacetica]|uniref:ABC transporter related protein n=1 Tax=Moorella thermoacetica (strain ATCC 39073 / JCM 9320) TaxID=264732 RepID=Q2RKL4_MOOTA|nr:energy-coupling factor transporter ATPase [Moorella thermoacetica]AKX96098.1 putative HMP/thiamine import ATP-binding protein YkoD [Moorella thermoacetica]OIQ55310.1 putative HMP/thiamine import ATP-binding protein YkoD [Moorella thermoacetica]OIQ55557.1 putative HMP/thiamine import ATP-binding protein YkoD [Moorella thermoacetica]QCZ99908.1 Putative HMP/thiamine import ATP-binding protein YkoD [Moorella thermoacetica]TYL07438.1 putative HMP/thiamine import ATP-binding protein YkoD [Moorell
MSLIEIRNLEFTYKGGTQPALKGIDLDINPGEFIVIMGHSGAGKSTLCLTLNGLVPNLKKGAFKGEVKIKGTPTAGHKVSHFARTVVLVFQDFETQLFSTSVELEVAFGPENFNVPPEEIKERVREALQKVRLTGFENRQPANLSGGQKQRLAIASVLSIQPEIICMDEPTTDLDPVGKYEVFSIASALRQEKHMSMIIVEHEVEEALEADRIILMKEGTILAQGTPREILSQSDLLAGCAVKPLDMAELFGRLGFKELPLTVEEGLEAWRRAGLALNQERYRSMVKAQQAAREGKYGEPIIEVKGLRHSYDKDFEALKGIDLTIRQGEFVAILGQNGSGKTTLVKHFNGLLRPTAGEVVVAGMDTRAESIDKFGRVVGYVFQNPDHQIFAGTVKEEVAYGPKLYGVPPAEIEERVRDALQAVELAGLEEEDPFSLTKGQRQRVAVASILAAKPRVIILDEPTTGLDYKEQRGMMELVRRLNDMGHTIIMVTHSMWVTAEYAHRVIVVKDGRVVMDGPTREVFAREEELEAAFLKPPQIVRFSNRLGATCLSVEEVMACLEGREGGAE